MLKTLYLLKQLLTFLLIGYKSILWDKLYYLMYSPKIYIFCFYENKVFYKKKFLSRLDCITGMTVSIP